MPDSLADLDFGRYHVLRLLGHGGMGEVYLARDADLERDVAIKFVSPARIRDSQARARLLREAQAAAALDHPNICAVHEAGVTPDGRAYIVMPYVEGRVLSDVIRGGTMPIREALSVCAQVADALAAAHRRGIVHRDLKPGNVILTPSGRPRLLDFGLAQTPIVPRVIAEATTVTAAATSGGGLVGTPAYMSPEQVQGRSVDGRSDLFSLGVMLYECFTGVNPFDGATQYDAVANILRLNPPAPSVRRKELTAREDDLCARLLAKEPADRFQSAEEVVGALRVLLPDTGRISWQQDGTAPVPRSRPRLPRRTFVAVTAAAAIVLAAVWWWTRTPALPPVPEDSARWYQRGTEALRDGASQTARSALEEAVRLYPQNVLAYARLAEADAELDDERGAQRHLLQLSSLSPDESRLPEDERLRIRAVRAVVLRQVDAAVAAYQELARRHPDEASAWVDLGRAQDAAGLRDDARASYEHALHVDPQYAAAHLQLGTIEAAAAHTDAALKAFGEAERLYRAASNGEGSTEVLLRRGAALDGSGEEVGARADLTQALTMATAAKNVAQAVRARLTLSSVAATEGKFAESEQAAADAVNAASAAGLGSIAADGLVDLTATLIDTGRLAEADTAIHRAIQLADDRGARRTAARARLQLAELRRVQERPDEAISLVTGVLPFLRSSRYRRFELFGLQIAARAEDARGNVEHARDTAAGVLRVAETMRDDGRIAAAASDLAAYLTALGDYPGALQQRERAEAIYRRQGAQGLLPYTLANHADLLIRLGHETEAQSLLDEIDAGSAAGLEAYKGRARRVASLKAFAAATQLRCQDAVRLAAGVASAPDATDSAALVTVGVVAYCSARLQRPSPPPAPPLTGVEAVQAADLAYWLAAAALARGRADEARRTALAGLGALGALPNEEVRWRLNTVAAAAASGAGDTPSSRELAAAAQQALERLRATWKSEVETYLSRLDLVDITRQVAATR